MPAGRNILWTMCEAIDRAPSGSPCRTRIADHGEAAQLKSGILIGYWDAAELRGARAEYGLD